MSDEYDYSEDPVPLYLLRFIADYDRGLKLEPVTRRQLEFEIEKYCGLRLAHLLLRDKLRKFPLRLAEFGEVADTMCLVLADTKMEFSTYIGQVTHYMYTPYGNGAEGFGLRSDTQAWLVPHEEGPAIFWAKGNEIAETNVMYWIDYWAQKLEDGSENVTKLKWPRPNEFNTIPIVPEEYNDPKYSSRHRRRGQANRRIS